MLPSKREVCLRLCIKSLRNWLFGLVLAVLIVAIPALYYRIRYTETKRLRVVTAGKVYRSGCMSGWGLEAAIKRYGIRTVINLMEEDPDPALKRSYFVGDHEKESQICRRHDARYRTLYVDLLPINQADRQRPETIDRFLEIMDDPSNYPVLIHCKAGLHRTGVLVGIYRMEYEGWSRSQALAEVRANGFGTFASTSANQYINQYILRYVPQQRPGRIVERMPASRDVPGTLTSRPLLPGAYEPLPK